MDTILNSLGDLGVIPVVAIESAAHAVPLGDALCAGGLPCAEITFRTAAAADAIAQMAAAFPGMLVGAGTVLTVEQAARAVDAGAKYIVSPGFDAAVVEWCLARGVPITPGVMTPTEISAALGRGLTVLKFFPAETAGGIKMLKAIGGPFGGIRFIPTGGISAANLADYLALPMVHACGGSWMVKKQLIADEQFATITALAQEAVQTVHQVRKQQ